MVGGKSFGAFKTAVMRVVKRGGYSPEWTQVTVFKTDRERLRLYSEKNHCGSLVEAMHKLLDDAKIRSIQGNTRNGKLKALVDSLRYRAKEFDPEKLSARIRDGEFDDVIQEYYINTNK